MHFVGAVILGLVLCAVHQNSARAEDLYSFNSENGFLLCSRRLLDLDGDGGMSANGDVLAVFTPHSRGFVTQERYFGGDLAGQTLGTASTCDFGSANPQYTINHGYASGVRRSTQYAGTSFLTLDLDVDNRTGRPWKSRDTAGMETIFDYDAMDRVTTIDPQDLEEEQIENDAWTRIRYNVVQQPPLEPQGAKNVIVQRCRQNSADCSDQGLLAFPRFSGQLKESDTAAAGPVGAVGNAERFPSGGGNRGSDFRGRVSFHGPGGGRHASCPWSRLS